MMANSNYSISGFDPFGWLQKFIPARYLHKLIHIAVIAVLCVFLIHRIGQYRDFLLKPLWVVETLVFVALIVSYSTRREPVERSRGVREIIVPIIGAVLPFALLLTSPSRWMNRNIYLLYAVFVWMTAATSLTLWGLWTLRRSFSITVECRSLITSGPYRWVRHPIYLGEILTAAGVLIWRFSLQSLLLFMIFVQVQLLRAGWEESKLENTFPEYRDYRNQSKWI
jgi:protein-S-isoprenylcysteine O-methyltransferase Ste14